jgi:hypothetical protein
VPRLPAQWRSNVVWLVARSDRFCMGFPGQRDV